MTHPLFARGSAAAASFAVPVLVIAALAVAGCSSQPRAARHSTESCVQFGMSAIRRHVTVTALPAACQGLTPAQIDAAAGAALRSAASGVRGKAQRRQRIVAASRYLAHMFVALPAPRGGGPGRQAAAGHWVSRAALSLIAVGAWLVTVALGLSLLARRMPRGVAAARRLPALNLAHLALAALSLLIWIGYLATAATGAAWAAACLLPLVAGIGMALLFLPRAQAPAGSAPLSHEPPSHDQASPRRAPVLTIGAHIAFATATILFAVLAATGAG